MPHQSKHSKIYLDETASSEAVSQAILFLAIITIASAFTVGGIEYVQTAQQDSSFEMGLIGFESIDDTIYKYVSHGSESPFATATSVDRIIAIRSTVEKPSNTTITIDDTYEITSQPLRISNQQFTLTYDTGIIQSNSREIDQVHRTPTDRYNTEKSRIFQAISTSYNPNEEFRGTNERNILISSLDKSETTTQPSGTTIEIETEQRIGWESYLEKHPQISSGSITTIDEGDGVFTIRAETSSETIFYTRNAEIESASVEYTE